MPEKKQVIDGYEALHTVRIDGADEIVAQNMEAGDHFRIYQRRNNNPLIAEYSVVFAGDDYMKVMREFTRRINAHLDSLELDRVYRGSPIMDTALTSEDCVKDGMNEDLNGKVIAIKAEALSPEFRHASDQIMLATGGFGCSPVASGTAVYCTNLYSGEQARWERYQVLGVVDESTLPEWAREKLAAMRELPERESVLAKLREAKSQPRQNRKPKKDQKSHGTEL